MNDTISTLPPASDAPVFDRRKRWAAYFSLAMIGAVLWPIQENWRDDPRDSFPLSYYPMFSRERKPVETFYYVIGQDAAGKRHQVRYKDIGDGGGNQVRRQLRRIMSEGHAPELAADVAARIAKKDGKPWKDVVSVSVIKGKYALEPWFVQGHKQPVAEKIYGFAKVERSSR
jgi:hypothetical protein